MDTNERKLYGSNDMVKVGCHDCMGCSSCCRDMGQSIWLDPYDVYYLTRGTNKSFEQLLEKEVEFHVEDGLILPNICMLSVGADNTKLPTKGLEPQCSFLNEEGRCSIHGFRPGFCRLFPLGRNYDGDKLTYFLLEGACDVPNKTKMKVDKWLNIPRIRDYEGFLVKWHNLTKGLRAFYVDAPENESIMKAVNIQFLQIFYLTPYDEQDFYLQFEKRMQKMQDFLKTIGIII